jgi:hypothetical protein
MWGIWSRGGRCNGRAGVEIWLKWCRYCWLRFTKLRARKVQPRKRDGAANFRPISAEMARLFDCQMIAWKVESDVMHAAVWAALASALQ